MKKTVRHTQISTATFLLVVFFCCVSGAVLGNRIDASLTPAQHETLRNYLTQYADRIAGGSVSLAMLLSVSVTYARYPTLLLLSGLTRAGVWMAPLICMMQGFFLSFAISGFVSAVGRSGVLLALSALGNRCLFTLPCIFLMAVWAMEHSRAVRQGKATRQVRSVYWRRAACLVPVLLMGMAAEVLLVPQLLSKAAESLT